jgi:hypothetical protein
MPQKKGAKGKKAAKVKDLPARSVKAKDAAKVKGGVLSTQFLKIDGAPVLKIDSSLPTQDQFLKISQ